MTFADKIKVNTLYTRSTNVERDRGSKSIIEAYLPTAAGLGLLEEITAVLGPDDHPRAWSLIGPYGSGKSSFALFLHELLGAGAVRAAASDVLAGARPDIADNFDVDGAWCRVVVSGSEEPLPGRLLAAMEDAATTFWRTRSGRKPTVLKRISEARNAPDVAASRVLELVANLQSAVDGAGGRGLLMIIDELGKFLEYEARRGGAGVFLLQQLAEQSYRGRQANLLLFVLLHQGFDLYARGFGEQLKDDWTKVQGRFQSVSFVEGPEQALRIMATAFSNDFTPTQRRSILSRCRRIGTALDEANALPAGFDVDEAVDVFAACYPLHPITLLALPALCQRFAQNERTLFGYLGSREPHGFRDVVLGLAGIGEWVSPADIYDYFVHNQPAVLADPLTHRRWAEVVTAIDGAENADGLQEANATSNPPAVLAKAIGVLNLISRSDGLKASDGVLGLLYKNKRTFADTVKRLLDASIVQYRRFSDEYRVWQGTDFDIDQQTKLERDKVGQFELAAALDDRLQAAPFVARRHAIDTGTLRYFNVTFVDAHSARTAATGDEPRIVFFLAEGKDDEARFDLLCQAASQNDIWVLHRHGASIRAVIADAMALEGVQRGGQELASDPVAAREVKERLEAARTSEQAALNALFGQPDQSEWVWRGEALSVSDGRTLQRALSDIMDRIFDQSPIVRNELANRDRLSSQGAAARNKLFQHMLEHQGAAGLGIEKYPPERAIYRSVLELGKLHIEGEAGWMLAEPGDDDPLNLRPAWHRLDALLEASESHPVTMEGLMDALAAPPYGIKRGIFPVIFLHYYLLHKHEIALYDEGVYSPELTYEHLERLVRRPDLFAFERFRVEGTRLALFEQYSEAIFGEVRPNVGLLELARPLTSFLLGLDDYAQKTRRLPAIALNVRQAFFLSKSPQKLLFEELPRACGFEPQKDVEGLDAVLVGALRDLKTAHDGLLEHMRSVICTAFGYPPATPLGELRELLRGRCHGLDRYTIDLKGLKSFIRRVANRNSTDPDWFAGIVLFLGHKPSSKWTDQDRDTAEYRLIGFAKRLVDLQRLQLQDIKPGQEEGGQRSILLKAASVSGGELEEVVSLTKHTEAAIASAKAQIERVMSSVEDNDLRLALVADLTSDFLTSYRETHSSHSRSRDGIREAG